MSTPTPLIDVQQLGTITEIKRGIVKLTGLPVCVMGQLVELGPRARGLVVGFTDDEVDALVLEPDADLAVGQRVTVHQQPWRLRVGSALLGRLLSPLGEPLDGQPVPALEADVPVFGEAPGIMQRTPIARPLLTGIKMIDTMVPLGKGQRELIIGDRMTGKTTLGLDVLLNQRGRQTICIYCHIGQSHQKLRQLTHLLTERQMREQTVVVAATAAHPASLQFLAPYAACAIGEWFMQQGRDVLVIFDDLSKHAWAYRQLSLLLNRPTGREAYPGDMFYMHAQLMERAGQLNAARGGGSMTFLPMCETQQGDVTGAIPSNLIAMTDGQLYLSSDLFYEGVKPAIDLGLSVSRIGNTVQSPALRHVSASLRLDALQHRGLKRFAAVAAQGTDRLRRGEVLKQILMQRAHELVSQEEQIALFYSFQYGWLERLTDEGLALCERGLFPRLPAAVQEMLQRGEPLTPNVQAALNAALNAVFAEVTHALPETVAR
jgi:F-type H+-transporting ATPase subunit alpha